jgi:hypothetical protein
MAEKSLLGLAGRKLLLFLSARINDFFHRLWRGPERGSFFRAAHRTALDHPSFTITCRPTVYSSIANMLRSFPYPECFSPPCGISVAVKKWQFTHVQPNRKRDAVSIARATLVDHTEDASP